MFRTHASRLGTLAVAATLALAACDDTSTGVESGQLSVLLTDAPGDFHSATVTISGIYLQGDDGEDAERVWLSEEEVTTDLLTLANDALELVNEVEVPAGNYAQLRFVITGGYIEVEQDDGSSRVFATQGYAHVPAELTVDGTLQMPSYEQSGLKVNLADGGVAVSGNQTVLLVDFNVAESFGQQAGASGMWVMTPVVTAVDFGLSSSVSVNLALAEDLELLNDVLLTDFTAHLDDGEGNTKEAEFVVDAETGIHTARFPFLMPGENWSLSIETPAGITVELDEDFPMEILTASGVDAEVDVMITAVAGG